MEPNAVNHQSAFQDRPQQARGFEIKAEIERKSCRDCTFREVDVDAYPCVTCHTRMQ